VKATTSDEEASI